MRLDPANLDFPAFPLKAFELLKVEVRKGRVTRMQENKGEEGK